MKPVRTAALLLGLGCGGVEPPSDEGPSSSSSSGSAGPASGGPSPGDGSSTSSTSATQGDSDASDEFGDTEPPSDTIDWRRQVIYLVMPDRFVNGDPGNDQLGVPECFDPASPVAYHGGDLTGLAERLDYVHELGATAVWTTPVYLQTTGRPDRPCPYHGYWADFAVPDDGAVEPRLGGEEAFAGLLAELHGRGLVYVMDMVVNHAGDDARITETHPGWFHDEATCDTLGDSIITCPFRPGSPDFAQELPEVADYLDDQSVGWLERFEIDAIRMDTARHVAPEYFSTRWLPAVRGVNARVFTIAEVFSDDTDEVTRYLDAGFDSAFAFDLRNALVDTFAEAGSVDIVAGAVDRHLAHHGLPRALSMVNFVDNHDLPRFTSIPDSGLDSATVAARHHLALVALFTLPGIVQLYYGNELGLLGGPDPDNRRDMPPWAFDATGRDQPRPGEAVGVPQQTFELVQRLAAERTHRDALAEGRYVEMWRQNGNANPNVWVFLRATDGDRLLIAINAGDVEAAITVPVAANGALEPGDRSAFVSGVPWPVVLAYGEVAPLEVDDETVEVRLPARSAALFAP